MFAIVIDHHKIPKHQDESAATLKHIFLKKCFFNILFSICVFLHEDIFASLIVLLFPNKEMDKNEF
jgi:hypothetical protein